MEPLAKWPAECQPPASPSSAVCEVYARPGWSLRWRAEGESHSSWLPGPDAFLSGLTPAASQRKPKHLFQVLSACFVGQSAFQNGLTS